MDPTPSTVPPDTTTEPVARSVGRLLALAIFAAAPLLGFSCLAGGLVAQGISFAFAVASYHGNRWTLGWCMLSGVREAVVLLSAAAVIGALIAWWYRWIFAAYVVRLRPLIWTLAIVAVCVVWLVTFSALTCMPRFPGSYPESLLALVPFAVLVSAFARRPYRGRILVMWVTALALVAEVTSSIATWLGA